MSRLTYENENGTWGIKGYDITKVPKELYGALCKLRDYERIGSTPDQLREIDKMYTELCTELAAEHNNGWIPCSERLPDESMCTDDCGLVTVETTEVLKNGKRFTFIEDYSLNTKEFLTPYKVIAWRNRPEPYCPDCKVENE